MPELSFFSIFMYRQTDKIDLSPENPESRTKMKGINRRQKKWIQPANYTWPTPDVADLLQVMGTLQCDYLNRGTWKKIIQWQRFFFESNRFSSFLANGPNNIQGSTIQPLKALKPFERTSPPRKEPSNLWMLLFRLKKKTWEFCFQKTLWLDNLLLSARRVRAVAL